ncbi:MAG: DUF255 domain-containing protein [Bacteroidota bacterium]
MKKTFLLVLLAVILAACSAEQATEKTADSATSQQVQPITNNKIVQPAKQKPVTKPANATNSDFKWYTLEDALAANNKTPKKFMIDMYTSWCGWCKVMDAKTFSDPQVQDYLDEHFYAIKFDAETRDKVNFNGEEFNFMELGRRGINGLAYKLMNGRASYPTIVYLDENLNPIRSAPGFKQVEQIMPELKYAATNAYKNKSLEEFQQSM